MSSQWTRRTFLELQGVQIIGPMYREDLCLDAAEVIESALRAVAPIDPKA